MNKIAEMKKINISITFIVLFLCAFSNHNEYAENKAEITYIANEGFLIQVNDKKILIDALFGDKEYNWCEVPDKDVMISILNNEGDYKDIDLIAASHNHVDHFHAPFVTEHLMNNSTGKFISCQQSVDEIKYLNCYNKLEKQIVEATPEKLLYIDTNINEINVRAYRLDHGHYYISDHKTGNKINKHRNVQNIGFLFNIDGIKIFHSGDSNADALDDYKNYRLDKENIDIAFLDIGFMWKTDCQGIEIIKKYINPKHIILMHIHNADTEKFLKIAKKLRTDFPSIHIFKDKMEIKAYRFE